LLLYKIELKMYEKKHAELELAIEDVITARILAAEFVR